MRHLVETVPRNEAKSKINQPQKRIDFKENFISQIVKLLSITRHINHSTTTTLFRRLLSTKDFFIFFFEKGLAIMEN